MVVDSGKSVCCRVGGKVARGDHECLLSTLAQMVMGLPPISHCVRRGPCFGVLTVPVGRRGPVLLCQRATSNGCWREEGNATRWVEGGTWHLDFVVYIHLTPALHGV